MVGWPGGSPGPPHHVSGPGKKFARLDLLCATLIRVSVMPASHSTTLDLLIGGLRCAPPPEPPGSRSGHGPAGPGSWPVASNPDSLNEYHQTQSQALQLRQRIGLQHVHRTLHSGKESGGRADHPAGRHFPLAASDVWLIVLRGDASRSVHLAKTLGSLILQAMCN